MKPLVSVIVTTRNNHETLTDCLESIKKQTYSPIELIIVDNNSTDDTKDIAARYTKHVYNKGPERSAQRNFGVDNTSGTFVLIVDSDMILGNEVVASCMVAVKANPALKAIIIPEESFGEGFWARCKQLERSFYVGQDTIEAARFFSRALYQEVGGYNEMMTGGEDWDLSRRIRILTDIGRVDAYIRHNEGRLYFGKTIRKFYYYAQHAQAYFAKNPTNSALTDKSGPLARYKLFFSQPIRLFENPVIGLGMLVLKTAEYIGGGAGLLKARFNQREEVDADS